MADFVTLVASPAAGGTNRGTLHVIGTIGLADRGHPSARQAPGGQEQRVIAGASSIELLEFLSLPGM